MRPFFFLSFGNRVLFCIAFNFFRCIVPLNKGSLKASSSLRRIFPLQIRWKRERESIWCIVRQMNNGCVFINKIQKREEKTVAKLSLSGLLHDSFLIQILNDLYFKRIFFLDKTLSFCGWVSFVRATFIRLAECISIINSVI